MSKMCRAVVVMLLMTSSVAAGQEKPAKPVETPAAKPPGQAREVGPPPGAGIPPPKPTETGQPVNVRIELTITDQRGDTTPITKTVTMIASDRSASRIRTQGDVRTPMGFRPVILNIDSRPVLIRDNRARVELTVEYRPVAAEADTEKSTTPMINESLSVILEDGKPTLISQSADPVTDRKVKVEATMTILR
jgi:hypothetical protein